MRRSGCVCGWGRALARARSSNPQWRRWVLKHGPSAAGPGRHARRRRRQVINESGMRGYWGWRRKHVRSATKVSAHLCAGSKGPAGALSKTTPLSAPGAGRTQHARAGKIARAAARFYAFLGKGRLEAVSRSGRRAKKGQARPLPSACAGSGKGWPPAAGGWRLRPPVAFIIIGPGAAQAGRAVREPSLPPLRAPRAPVTTNEKIKEAVMKARRRMSPKKQVSHCKTPRCKMRCAASREQRAQPRWRQQQGGHPLTVQWQACVG